MNYQVSAAQRISDYPERQCGEGGRNFRFTGHTEVTAKFPYCRQYFRFAVNERIALGIAIPDYRTFALLETLYGSAERQQVVERPLSP